jgi:hypothetical protein
LSDHISHHHSHIAGVAFFTIRAQITQAQGGFLSICGSLGLPELLVESLEAAVEVVRGVIRGERVFAAVEFEFRPADAPRDTADERSKKRMLAEVCQRSLQNAPPVVTSKCTTFDGCFLGSLGSFWQGVFLFP